MTRNRARSFTFCVLALLALAPALRAQADAPLSKELLDRLPETYRERAKDVRLSEEAQKYFLTASEKDLLEFVASGIARKPDGLPFLVTAADTEKSGARRGVLFESLGRAKSMPEYIERHPEALLMLSKHASSDSDAAAALAALNAIRRIRNDQLAKLIRQRMELARANGAQPDLELLSEEESRHYKWFGEIAMPEAYRDAPPLFSAVSEEKPIRVLAFGDFGSGQESQVKTAAAIRAYAKDHPFDFGITLGDNFYPRGMNSPSDPRWKTQWEDLYGPLGIKFYASLGNHDYGQAASPIAELWYSEKSPSWHAPARYYTFTAGSAQFFQIDTVDLTERELRWLDEQLAQSKATWKIVYGHYQIYSASRGDNDEEQEDLIHRLLPILKKRGADLYICGHDHNLQILKADGGVNFVVAGGGGAGLYDFEQEEYTRSVFKAKAYGFAVIEADRTNLNVRLVNAEGKELSALKLKK
jgi:predicted MPP superfamily phosphohydrolase